MTGGSRPILLKTSVAAFTVARDEDRPLRSTKA
jgi:hypothetical protein